VRLPKRSIVFGAQQTCALALRVRIPELRKNCRARRERWAEENPSEGIPVLAFPCEFRYAGNQCFNSGGEFWDSPDFPDTEIRWHDDLGGIRWGGANSLESSSSRQ
jgi:hypothetical protein